MSRGRDRDVSLLPDRCSSLIDNSRDDYYFTLRRDQGNHNFGEDLVSLKIGVDLSVYDGLYLHFRDLREEE